MNKRIKKKYKKLFRIESKHHHVPAMEMSFTINNAGYKSLPPNIGKIRKHNRQLYIQIINSRKNYRSDKSRGLLIQKLQRDEERRKHIGMIGFDSIGFGIVGDHNK